MPLCWIFLLKRRRALSNVSFSPTRTSANPGSPPQASFLDFRVRLPASGTDTLRAEPVRGWRSIAEGPGAVKRFGEGSRADIGGGQSRAVLPFPNDAHPAQM